MSNLMTTTAAKIKTASFSVNGAELAAAVAPASKVAGAMYGREGCVTLAFRDQRLAVQATDFESTVEIKVAVKGKKATTVSVNAANLAKFTRALAKQQVTIDVSEDAVNFTSADTDLQFTLPPVLDAAEIKFADEVDPCEVDPAALVTTIGLTVPCVSTDDARAILTGVLFDNGVAAATDSYKLMVVADAPILGAKVLIPGRSLKIIGTVFDGVDELTFDQATMTFASPMRRMTVRQIDGEFPNYRNLLPVDSSLIVGFIVDRKVFADRLKNVDLATSDGTPARLAVVDSALTISVNAQDIAASRGAIDVDADSDIPEIGFNPAYLAASMGSADSVQVNVRFADPMKPFTVTPVDSGSWTFLQMPVRLAS